MTEESLLLAIQDLLQAMVWTGGSNKVFHTNSVIISAGPSSDVIGKLVMPLCIISPGGQQADLEQPDLYTEGVDITIIASVPGDFTGEGVLMGANRVATTSKGAGIIQLGEAVLDVINKLNAADSIVIQHVFSSAVAPVQLENKSWINARKLSFKALINH